LERRLRFKRADLGSLFGDAVFSIMFLVNTFGTCNDSSGTASRLLRGDTGAQDGDAEAHGSSRSGQWDHVRSVTVKGSAFLVVGAERE
jgi:hypothetical protein